jgi:RNA polymerase sigma-70 factor (ECF subfamily)
LTTEGVRPDGRVWDAVLAQRPRAERVARARCASADDVEDCVQEAMARVAAMPDLDLARIGPLVTVVVANLAADACRRRARTARTAARVWRSSVHVPAHDDEICDRYEARWLRSRMDALPAQDRRSLELRAAGLPVGEIAERLGVTYKAAEHALGRARQGMRAVWRATAALAGLLWGARVRAVARTAPGLAAAALATACLGSVLAQPAEPPPGGSAAGDAFLTRHAPPTAPRTVPAPRRPRAVPGGGAGPTAQGVAGPARSTRAAVAPVSVGVVRYGGLSEEHRDHHETPQQTVERCLRHVTVAVDHVECDG